MDNKQKKTKEEIEEEEHRDIQQLAEILVDIFLEQQQEKKMKEGKSE